MATVCCSFHSRISPFLRQALTRTSAFPSPPRAPFFRHFTAHHPQSPLCIHVSSSSFFLSPANLYARANFNTRNYVNRICPRVGCAGSVRVGDAQIKSCFESIVLPAWRGGTYWWCCIGRRRTSPDRAATPSGPRRSWASRCRCHRWRCRSRVPSLWGGAGGQRCQAVLAAAQDYLHNNMTW